MCTGLKLDALGEQTWERSSLCGKYADVAFEVLDQSVLKTSRLERAPRSARST